MHSKEQEKEIKSGAKKKKFELKDFQLYGAVCN